MFLILFSKSNLTLFTSCYHHPPTNIRYIIALLMHYFLVTMKYPKVEMTLLGIGITRVYH